MDISNRHFEREFILNNDLFDEYTLYILLLSSFLLSDPFKLSSNKLIFYQLFNSFIWYRSKTQTNIWYILDCIHPSFLFFIYRVKLKTDNLTERAWNLQNLEKLDLTNWRKCICILQVVLIIIYEIPDM